MTDVTRAVEVERKYDVESGTPLPDLGASGWLVRPPERLALHATYFDTPDLRLRAARTTLRRRTGGHDAGWHLKLPAGADRQELRLPPLGDEVPGQLAELVHDLVSGRPLEPVALLSTDRTVQVVCDAAGTPLAEVADDRVVARRLPGGPDLQWREWEVELLGEDRTVLDRLEGLLLAAGARPSSSGSKVGRVLSA